jgi:hypothetical protein
MQDSAAAALEEAAFLDPAVDTPLTKGSGSTAKALYFSTICRTFSSGGTRIRTGDTMIFRSVRKPTVHRHRGRWAVSKRFLEVIDPRETPPNAVNRPGVVVALWWAQWVPDRRLCTLSDLLILTATSQLPPPFRQASLSDWGGAKISVSTPLPARAHEQADAVCEGRRLLRLGGRGQPAKTLRGIHGSVG